MKIIRLSFLFFIASTLCAADLNPATLARIQKLEDSIKETRADIAEWSDEIKWQRRMGRKPNSNTAQILGYSRTELEHMEAELKDLKEGKAIVAEPKPAAFYAPPPIFVPETNKPAIRTNAPAAKASTNSPAAPKDWRTPEQKAKWEAIEKQFSKWPEPPK